MSLTLTELGASPAAANPGGACAGHLVRGGGAALVLDCGFGAAGRLRAQLPLADLGAIVISHLHPDHYADLVPLRYALTYAEPRAERVPLYLPPGGIERMRGVGRALPGDAEFFAACFAMREYAPGETLEIADVQVTLLAVQHYIPSHAMRVRAGGRVLVYSADVAPCRALEEAAGDADLFLCEASLLGVDEDEPDPARRGHLTAEEAGRVARAAGVGRLLLTHCPLDRRDARRAAAETGFGAGVDFAVEGESYSV